MPESVTTAPEAAPPAPAPESGKNGPQSVWDRFICARGAKFGLSLVVSFSLVAFLAPFLAHRLPFLWRDGVTGEFSLPLIREFFAPSDTTEPALERGINFLFVFVPLACIAWRLMNKYLPSSGRVQSRFISLLFGAMFAAALWAAIGGMLLDAGGKDWLYQEQPPVPEIDDIADPYVMPPAEAHLTDEGKHDEEMQRRLLIGRLQELVEGPALLRPAGNFNAHGLEPDNLEASLDRARWNRLVLESEHPGLLHPMRQFRSTYIIMMFVSLLVLLGLTYICLAGAWQFALSPQWLLLLVLAAVVALPFRLPTRHDHTPYRELSAEGKGWGIFPPIPYGPNEQGFGPRLPPSWYTDRPEIGADSVLSWHLFRQHLERGDSPGAKRLEKLLAARIPDWTELSQSEAGRPQIIKTLNELVDAGAVYDGDTYASMRGDMYTGAYLSRLRSGEKLSTENIRRFNRLLVERALPGTLSPVNAARWKKPNHTPAVHALGTDESGRDVLVRIIHGARVSLSVGFVSVFLATVIGLVLGSLAAYYGGKTDMLISRFLEIMMCFPSFFLILAVIAVLDRRSIVNIMLVIGLTSWTGVARLIRGEMLRQKKMDYVSASIALGASDTRTIFRHILPNAMAPVLVSISFGITGAILTEAGLSFIGFGVTPPTPTWGQLLSETRDSPLANWWLAVFPGIVLFVSVLAYNMVGEALRDALDPRTTV